MYKPDLICLQTHKWFQVFLSNTDNSIQQYFPRFTYGNLDTTFTSSKRSG